MINLEPIGMIYSCYPTRFGIPRQSGLAPSSEATLEIFPPHNQISMFYGIENFTHLWIIFLFHANKECKKTKIRVPRWGGERKLGVFASRTSHRPNPIGLSLATLVNVTQNKHQLLLHLCNIDILDKTPILDIKPYLPYTDCQSNAQAYHIDYPSKKIKVLFSKESQDFCQQYQKETDRKLDNLIIESLQFDPRPCHLKNNSKGKKHHLNLWDVEIFWYEDNESFYIERIHYLPPPA